MCEISDYWVSPYLTWYKQWDLFLIRQIFSKCIPTTESISFLCDANFNVSTSTEDVLLSVAEIASYSNCNSMLWTHLKPRVVYVNWKRKIIEVEGNLLLNLYAKVSLRNIWFLLLADPSKKVHCYHTIYFRLLLLTHTTRLLLRHISLVK